MWANLKTKSKEFLTQIKGIKLPSMAKPDFSASLSKAKTLLGGLIASIEAKHLVYFALILMPAIVGLGAYYGIINSKAQLEAANLPENQLARRNIAFTAENFVKYAGRGEKDITALFIDAGMPPDSYRKNDGFTPLHAAAAYGRISIVRQLIDKGADVNARDKEGQTALMKAVWNSHADVVGVLIQRGANLTASDAQGNTAVNMAKVKNDRRVLDTLVKVGITELKENLDKLTPASKKSDKLPNTADSNPQVAKAAAYPVSRSNSVRSTAPATAPSGQFILATGYAGVIGVGKSTDAIYQEYGKQAVTGGEEFLSGRTYPVLHAFVKGASTPALTVFFARGKEQEKVITAIRVLDKRYKTASGIGVGSTLGELRQAGNISSIQYTDSLYAFARDSKMQYELDISSDNIPVAWLNGGDANSLPDDMKVRSIYIF